MAPPSTVTMGTGENGQMNISGNDPNVMGAVAQKLQTSTPNCDALAASNAAAGPTAAAKKALAEDEVKVAAKEKALEDKKKTEEAKLAKDKKEAEDEISKKKTEATET